MHKDGYACTPSLCLCFFGHTRRITIAVVTQYVATSALNMAMITAFKGQLGKIDLLV
jgi:hypothetical protein